MAAQESMSAEAALINGLPGVIRFEDRDDFFLRATNEDDAKDMYGLIMDNPYMWQYQTWMKGMTTEKAEEGLQHRLQDVEQGSSIQYRMIAADEEHNGGMVGTITAYDYDREQHSVKIGYYQAESSQGKGRVNASVVKVLGLLRDTWGVQRAEFDIEIGNAASEQAARRLGAVLTNEVRYYDPQGEVIDHKAEGASVMRVWKLGLGATENE